MSVAWIVGQTDSVAVEVQTDTPTLHYGVRVRLKDDGPLTALEARAVAALLICGAEQIERWQREPRRGVATSGEKGQ